MEIVDGEMTFSKAELVVVVLVEVVPVAEEI